MSIHARSIALAWIAVLAKPALCFRPRQNAEWHQSAQAERQGERSKPDVHEEEEQEDHEQEDSSAFRKRGPEKTKFIAGVPVLNYHEFNGGARERNGVDMASLGEFEDEQKWLVMMSPNTSDADLEDMCKIPPGCNFTSMGGLPLVRILGTETNVADMIMQANVAALYVEFDLSFTRIRDIVEPVQADSGAAPWGLTRIGADGRSARAGLGATVFVLDSGVLVTHTEFSGRAAPGYDTTDPWPNGRACNGDQNCAQDRNGHGTHCAGTAVGQDVGVAPGANVMSIKAMRDDGVSDVYYFGVGLGWITDELWKYRPAVASISFAAPASAAFETFERKIDRAVEKGLTIVVAAGNEKQASCTTAPAKFRNVITVGATDSSDQIAWYSNYGKCTNIWAPGSSVRSAWYTSTDSYNELSGSSFACPHASGVVALIQGLNKKATPREVRDELMKYAEKDALSGLGKNDVNELLSARRLPCQG